METIIKSTVNVKDALKAAKEAKTSKASEGTTSNGVFFRKLRNLLILM